MTVTTIESEVRSYSRNWPVVFEQARGSRMTSRDGRVYLDFFMRRQRPELRAQPRCSSARSSTTWSATGSPTASTC